MAETTPTVNYPPQHIPLVLQRLRQAYPGVGCELVAASTWELLVAVILSAQTSDQRVNMVMAHLQEKLGDIHAYAQAPLRELERAIQQVPLYRQKARYIKEAAQTIERLYAGEVPSDEDRLRQLPGVGGKTAAVVLGNGFGIPTIAVDSHVQRVVTRIGLSRARTPRAIERELARAIPPQHWVDLCHQLIRLGRDHCRPQNPWCSRCPLQGLCCQYDVEQSR